MQDAKTAVAALTDNEFESFLYWVLNVHREERKTRRAEEQAKAKVLAELMAAGKLPSPKFISLEEYEQGTKPPSWSNPNGDELKGYPYEAVVSRYRRVYSSSLRDGLNLAEPGTEGSGWEDVTDQAQREPEPGLGEQPALSEESEGSTESPAVQPEA